MRKLKKKGQKSLLWEKISDQLKAKKYNYNAKHCDEKWRRLLTRFRQVRDASKCSGSEGIKWQYYKLMQATLTKLKRQAISPPKSNF